MSEQPPSGLPPEQDEEEQPLGVTETDPEHEDNGPQAMPGIPTEGEPPTAG